MNLTSCTAHGFAAGLGNGNHKTPVKKAHLRLAASIPFTMIYRVAESAGVSEYVTNTERKGK